MPFSLRVLVGLILLTALAGGARAANLETLPVQAPAGAEVTARGDSYVPDQVVTLRLTSVDPDINEILGDYFANGEGRLFAQYNIPDVPVGPYVLEARDRLGSLLATAVQEVTESPDLTLDPVVGGPGTRVGVRFGPVPAGSVELHYDGIRILGPLQHAGGDFIGEFLVPADFPDPLGELVDVQAISRSGSRITATAWTVFETEMADATGFRLLSAELPEATLRGGQSYQVTGQLALPAGVDPEEVSLTLVWITADDVLIPVNHQPIQMDATGHFVADATAPSLASGSPLANLGATDDNGMVYKTPKQSGLFILGPVKYGLFENQPITFEVTSSPSGEPLEGAAVRVFHNSVLLPIGFEFDEDGTLPGVSALSRGVADLAFKHSGSVFYHGPNQYADAFHYLAPQVNPVTGCELTLENGVTDSNGEFTINTWPIVNYLFSQIAYSINDADINTTMNAPGVAEFTVNVNALTLNHGLPNDYGACSGQRFDFQFHVKLGGEEGVWLLRESLDGDFNKGFDPNVPLLVPLVEIDPSMCDLTTPTQPYMPGLTIKEIVSSDTSVPPIYQFGALWSFPDTNGVAFNMLQPPQVRLPHADGIFGALTDLELYFGDQLQGPMDTDDFSCSEAGVEYVIDLPQLTSMPAGIVEASIQGKMNDIPFERALRIHIKEGPEWIKNPTDFASRSITWSPETVLLTAEEHELEQDASVTGVDQGVGDLANKSLSNGTVQQTLKSTGSSSRRRVGTANSEVTSEATDPADSTVNPSGPKPVPFGSTKAIEVLNTGRIPLFRYAWGIWPIATATVGADIWVTADFLYHGFITHTNKEVLLDLTTAATASLGLEAWINVSAILDLVSVTGFALPQIDVGLPIEIEKNQPQDVQPCFRFLLDMAYAVKVGWCPFCVKAEDTANLIDEVEGNCDYLESQLASRAAIPEPPATDRTAVAVDGLGAAMAVWGDESGGINIQQIINGVPANLVVMPAAPGAMAPDIAFLDANDAVLVWAQTSLNDEDFYAFEGDPGGVIPFQHLVYRTWDGSDWSETLPLTAPSSGDGGVVLAACPASDPACPAGGEVLAVWVNDAASDIGQHDLRLRYAFFDGFGWTAPAEVDPASTHKDLQPAVTYLDGEPVVAWVRNPGVTRDASGATLDLMQRRIAYRFLRQAGGVQEPAELPLGVSWPSISPFGNNGLVLAFTVATEPDAFLGTRQSLHTAMGVGCSQGKCSFSATERTDGSGRRFFAESPRLTTSNDGYAVVTFRQLGTDNPMSGDPPGVLSHTGALVQASFQLILEVDPVTTPVDLGFDHAVNWHLDAVYDPATNQVMSTAVQVGQLPETLTAQRGSRVPIAGVTRSSLGSGAVSLTQRTLLPDFEVISAEPSRHWIPDGETIEVSVQVRNNGILPQAGQIPVVAAYWDGPAGLGQLASQQPANALESGVTGEVVLEIGLPAGFHPDEAHDLHLVINPLGALDEFDAGNNEHIIKLGELPAPQNLRGLDDRGARIVVIHWDPVDDPRVTGYRVYRRNPDDSIMAVGSTYVAGFADLSAYPNQVYEYFVVSHSGRMMESAPSEAIPVSDLREWVFRDRFQSAQ